MHDDWNPPDNDKLRELAKAWRDALCNADQDEITSQYGIHWSEFWWLSGDTSGSANASKYPRKHLE
jgi:hypothetical protein